MVALLQHRNRYELLGNRKRAARETAAGRERQEGKLRCAQVAFDILLSTLNSFVLTYFPILRL